MRDGQGKHHRDVRDIEATDTLRCLLAEWQPLQRPARATQRRVLAALTSELVHLATLPLRTPRLRPRHDATFVIRSRVA